MSTQGCVRGVVEGFYGRPWAWSARNEAVRVLAERGANAYVYAPKDDPWHRGRWREPYPDDELAQLVRFASACAQRDVAFGFAISPGLDIAYGDDADFIALTEKLAPIVAATNWVVLALDDIRARPGLGSDHAHLATALLDWLLARDGSARLSLVPTEYIGSTASAYLRELSAELPDDVDVMWTGSTVCSPTITAAEAKARADVAARRPPLLWDNYPVNDAMLSNALHLAPYTGRDADLPDATAGVLLNPMVQARPSLVPLLTALDFWSDPHHYDPMRSWDDALEVVGRDRSGAWRALGEACWSSPLHAPDTVPLARLADTDIEDSLEALVGVADAAIALPTQLTNDPAASEIMPWAEQVQREGRVIRAAVRVHEVLDRVPLDRGRATARAFVLLSAWSQARTASALVAYGPRFAAVPALVGERLDVRAAVLEDASAVDRLARRALDAYEAATK